MKVYNSLNGLGPTKTQVQLQALEMIAQANQDLISTLQMQHYDALMAKHSDAATAIGSAIHVARATVENCHRTLIEYGYFTTAKG